MFSGSIGINLNQRPPSQLDKIINLSLGDGEPDGTCKTTVVSLHLAQMREWGARGGNVQFKAIQDKNSIRKDYILDFFNENSIKQRTEPTFDRMIGKGEVLLVVMPSKVKTTGYRIDFYTGGKNNTNPDYYVFYEENEYGENEIECVVFKSSHDLPHRNNPMGSAYDLYGNAVKRWKLTFANKKEFIQFSFNQEPLDLRSVYFLYKSFVEGNTNVPFTVDAPIKIDNPFTPEFPFEICKNNGSNEYDPGIDDFYPIKDLIEDHNGLLIDAMENLSIFYSPTMITSRPADKIVEDLENFNQKKSGWWGSTWAAQNGYNSLNTNKQTVNYRMPRVLGNIKSDERFGYIEQPDTISGDHNLFIRSLRELIHWTLGGVDPLGISSSATFGEIKSLFGRIENTAMKKADTLFGQKGICSLLSKIILAEERKCKFAIAQFIINQFLQGSNLAAELVQQTLTDEEFRALYFNITEQLGLTLPGLPPLGDRTCSWRYTKDVFQRTTQEQLQSSIVYRNTREDGISQEIALGSLYPNMSDEEIRLSMSGFSPRVVSNAIGGISGALQLYMQLSQVPSPENPEISWAQSLGLAQIVEQGIITLQKEMQFNIPDFREEPDIGQVNATINHALQELRNVRTANPQSGISSANPALPTANPYTVPNGFTRPT